MTVYHTSKTKPHIKQAIIRDYQYELAMHKATLANADFDNGKSSKINYAIERIEFIENELAYYSK